MKTMRKLNGQQVNISCSDDFPVMFHITMFVDDKSEAICKRFCCAGVPIFGIESR